MIEDKLLVWRFKHGSRAALCQIYEKYKNDLLKLAVVFSNDKSVAEDIVHDVFVSFAQFADKLDLKGNLKGYLLSSVANRVRNLNRAKHQESKELDEAEKAAPASDRPDRLVISTEGLQRVSRALAQLPFQQREVIILHIYNGLKFKAIAKLGGVSVHTIRGRYRYGLDRLRSLLNSEVAE
jgi:RNA polymerase sigma-70 factor (ECF subfamily)